MENLRFLQCNGVSPHPDVHPDPVNDADPHTDSHPDATSDRDAHPLADVDPDGHRHSHTNTHAPTNGDISLRQLI